MAFLKQASLKIEDPEVTGFLTLNVINEILHYIMHYGSPFPEDRVLEGLTQMMKRFLEKR